MKKEKVRITGLGDLDRPVKGTVTAVPQTRRERNSSEWPRQRRIRYQRNCIVFK